MKRIRPTNGIGLLALLGLVSGRGKELPPASSVSTLTNGQALVAIVCAQCHTVLSPSHLAPEEWPYLLAWMGNYLGYPQDIEINQQIVIKKV